MNKIKIILKPVTVIAFILMLLLVACGNLSNGQRIELSFKVGAMYAIKAQEDPRYKNCKTLEDVADLAWKMYKDN